MYAGSPHCEQSEDGGDRGRNSNPQRNGKTGRVTSPFARVSDSFLIYGAEI